MFRLTPLEERLLQAARDLGPDQPIQEIAKAAQIRGHGYAYTVRRRLQGMGVWPQSDPKAPGGSPGGSGGP